MTSCHVPLFRALLLLEPCPALGFAVVPCSSRFSAHSGPPNSGPNHGDRGNRRGSPPHQRGRGRQASPQNNDKEAAKIEKRIAKERPCRILFIRNIKVSGQWLKAECRYSAEHCLCVLQYSTDGGILKRKFAEMGEMKSFFDLISSRGLVFVTYVSLSVLVGCARGRSLPWLNLLSMT